MGTAEQAKLLALTELSGVGDKRALELVDAAGGVQAVYDAPRAAFSDFHYVDEETYESLAELDAVVERYRARIEEAAASGVELLTPLESAYPDGLRDQHAPLRLFVAGNRELLRTDCVSFAGSRDASEETVAWTRETSRGLAEADRCIVSGGAFGVDAAAHEAALEAGGDTILVSPSGHGNPSPAAHSDLFAEVAERGLVVSHRFPEQDPARGGYLYRNKTNSALSSSLVVAAAGADGGSMAQYRTASKQGKQIFVPAEPVGVAPEEGIAKMRADDDVTEISSYEGVLEADDGGTQQRLDDW